MRTKEWEFWRLQVMYDGKLGYETDLDQWVPFLPEDGKQYQPHELYAMLEIGTDVKALPISDIISRLQDVQLEDHKRGALREALAASRPYVVGITSKPVPEP